MAFVVGAENMRLAWDGGWSDDSDEALTRLVDQAPAKSMPVASPGPFVEPDWSDEVWVYLHALDALRYAGFDPVVEVRPDFPALDPLGDAVA